VEANNALRTRRQSLLSSIALLWSLIGFTDALTSMFPPFPTPNFVPDYTGYDLDQHEQDWYATHKYVAQTPAEALKMVKKSLNEQCVFAYTPCFKEWPPFIFNNSVKN